AGRTHRLLFDTWMTPTGCVDNLRRLGHDPGDIEAVVCSHGHLDHTTGLSGLMTVLGQQKMPVLMHPEFWTRRSCSTARCGSPAKSTGPGASAPASPSMRPFAASGGSPIR